MGLVSVVVPFTSSFKPLWTGLGAVAVDLLIAVAISSALRQRIAARPVAAASTGWPTAAGRFAMAHALGTGTDAGQLWMDAIAAACTVAVVAALAWRILEHRSAGEAAVRVGRDHPGRARPAPGPPDPGRPGRAAHPRSSGGAPRRYPATGPDRTRPPPSSSKGITDDHRHACPASERLLHAGPGVATDPGLAGHLALHGPLAVPAADDPPGPTPSWPRWPPPD